MRWGGGLGKLKGECILCAILLTREGPNIGARACMQQQLETTENETISFYSIVPLFALGISERCSSLDYDLTALLSYQRHASTSANTRATTPILSPI